MLEIIGAVARKSAGLFRTATTLHPKFLLKNVARDTPDRMFYSDSLSTPEAKACSLNLEINSKLLILVKPG